MANTNDTALALLRADLGFFSAPLDESMTAYLLSLVESATFALTDRCKIQLIPGDVYDDHLLAMYAAWLYRKRASGGAMPDMLRCEIRDRQIAKAMKKAANGEESA